MFTRFTRNPLLLFGLTLTGVLLCTGALIHLYLQQGFSATLLLIILINSVLLSQLFTLFNKQNKQLSFVIKALANGDSTLGLCASHPMSQQYIHIKDKMQLSRFKAEQQAQFLNTLLVHIELAVLVCDQQGKVIKSNPAAAKLLGKPITHLQQLGRLSESLLTTDKGLKTIAQWLNGEQQDTLSIQLSVTEIQGQCLRLVTLQSVRDELLNKEQQAYKSLTRVLTHEVANSITPLSSIAQTCKTLLPETLTFTDLEEKHDLSLALNTLASRTQHLGQFIARFKQVSSLPKPNLTSCDLSGLIKQVSALYHSECEQSDITCYVHIDNTYLIMIDSAQIEQVLVNLIKNAIEAIKIQQNTDNRTTDRSKKRILPQSNTITLTLAQNSAQQVYVDVADSGMGVAEHVVEMMFVPFFTTKQQGSGIGLSLSKQIMVNHGGDLLYIKRLQGACFRCIFG